jgi:hypothetical protein
MGPGEVEGRSFFGSDEVVATLAAEFELRKIEKMALRADPFQSRAAFPTKSHSVGISSLAFRAVHFLFLVGDKILMRLIAQRLIFDVRRFAMSNWIFLHLGKIKTERLQADKKSS